MSQPRLGPRNLSNQFKSQVKARFADSLKVNPIGNIQSSVSLTSAQDSRVAAIATGNQKLSEDAQQIANPHSERVTGSLVHLNQALVLAEAGAAAISTGKKMLGALFDAFA